MYLNLLLPSSATAMGEVWAELVVGFRWGRVSNLLQTPPTYTISLDAMGPGTLGQLNPRASGTLCPGMTREQNLGSLDYLGLFIWELQCKQNVRACNIWILL